MDDQQKQEIMYVVEQLQHILGTDNQARKEAEEKIKKIREGEPDKYVYYLSTVIRENTIDPQIRSLSAVVLRRTLISYNETTKQQLWEQLSGETKTGLKQAFFEPIKAATQKDFVHKLSNLLVEIQGAMFEENEEIWQELLSEVFVLVNSEQTLHVDAALQIFNGLFQYIMDHLNKYKDELKGIFVKTLSHPSLDIKLAALRAVSCYLETVE